MVQNAITPTTNTGGLDNGNTDLGGNTVRFNNLYLAGTANFGSLSDGTITITGFADEDDMSSNSATLVPTQQSVKAYVDSQVSSAGGSGISFADDEKATFGDGLDLEIYHDGSHSYIKDVEQVVYLLMVVRLYLHHQLEEVMFNAVQDAQVLVALIIIKHNKIPNNLNRYRRNRYNCYC